MNRVAKLFLFTRYLCLLGNLPIAAENYSRWSQPVSIETRIQSLMDYDDHALFSAEVRVSHSQTQTALLTPCIQLQRIHCLSSGLRGHCPESCVG